MKPPARFFPQNAAASPRWLLVLLFLAISGWLWTHLCAAPWQDWNDLRLGAALMAAHGVNPYSVPESGVMSTWLYGPISLWAWAPAALAPSAPSAMLTGVGLNAFYLLGSIALCCRRWPIPATRPGTRWLAFGLCLALLPAKGLELLLADNLAVALTLVSNALLLSDARGGKNKTWLAALCSAAAVGSKQTFAPLILAQCLWLLSEHGSRACLRYAGQVAVSGGVLLAPMAAQFGLQAPWYCMVTLPRLLPWSSDLFERIVSVWPGLSFLVLLPFLILLVCPKIFGPGHLLRLAGFCWVAFLPLDTAGFLAVGGALNSFHGLAIIGPPLLLHGLAVLANSFPRALPAAAICSLFLIAAQWLQEKHRPLRPLLAHLNQAIHFARQHPQQVWFPWHPVVGYYANGAFYHTEDGWYTRALAKQPPSAAWLQAGLPAQLRYIALARANWGLAETFADPELAAISWTGSPWRLAPIKSRLP